MKIFGHPVHLMLIHFPSALFPMSFICSLAAVYMDKPPVNDAAFFAMAGGVAGGWLAAIAGFLDLATVVEKKPAAVKKALIHGGVNTAVLTGFSLFLYKANKYYPALVIDSKAILVIKGVLIMAMIVGNFIGGSLVLKDKINVEE